ncbi:hypothetical protein P2W50_01120 [Pseudomonas protegens]|uniref:hypothetical protein n=1 Tax=Pseudomonas protegens TaxID=380021 RepID=UPI0023ED41B2|nr:hypothetical protein [Pseudomonas protegens]MDF4205194.1 hypothetical protein [Pseudomonas protegens]
MQKESVINKHQRIALLLTLAMTILVLLLHFPFDGYVTEITSTVPSFTRCPKADLQTMRAMGAEEFNNALAACQEKVFVTELPISDWRSNGAPIYWFASPIHALATALSILLIGLAWFFSVRPTGTPAK